MRLHSFEDSEAQFLNQSSSHKFIQEENSFQINSKVEESNLDFDNKKDDPE